jgi:hypothetical protein
LVSFIIEPAGRVIGDPAEHVFEPGLRVDVVELGGGDQRVDRCCPVTTAVGTREQPVFPAMDAPFGVDLGPESQSNIRWSSECADCTRDLKLGGFDLRKLVNGYNDRRRRK